MYAEAQLKKVKNWGKVIIITDSKENGEWTQFAKDCGVEATPTLIALIDGKVVAKVTGSQDMTSEFWGATVEKHSIGKQ
jgi:hypothetical protein